MGERNRYWDWITYIGVAGAFAVMIWLIIASAKVHKPKCSIEYFYVPALNKSLHSKPLNTTLNFMIRLDNINRMYGFHYEDVLVSISNTFNSSNSSFLAIYTIPKFYQGRHKKAKKWGQALPFNDQSLLRAVLPNGSAIFSLGLKTRVGFGYYRGTTKTYGIEVGANVEVNDEGAKAAKEEIEMKKSDSSSPLTSYFPLCVLMNLLVFFAIL